MLKPPSPLPSKKLWSAATQILLLLILSGGVCDENPSSSDDDDGPLEEVPGPVTNARIACNTSSPILRIDWDDPAFGSAVTEGYRVYFTEVGSEASTDIIDSVLTTYVNHDPSGKLGIYDIYAYNEYGLGEGVEVSHHLIKNLTGDPPNERPILLGEISSAEFAFGIRWDAEGWSTHKFVTEASLVDLYLTDKNEELGAGPYFLSSPTFARYSPHDSLVIVGTGNLNQSLILDLGTERVDLMPDMSQAAPEALLTEGHWYAAISHTGEAALIRVDSLVISPGGSQATTLHFLGLVPTASRCGIFGTGTGKEEWTWRAASTL